jgi:hypothetical protein
VYVTKQAIEKGRRSSDLVKVAWSSRTGYGPGDRLLQKTSTGESVISRDEARTIAIDALAGRRDLSFVAVRSLEEVAARPPILYLVLPVDLHACWIAYFIHNRMALESSVVVLVSKADGRVAAIGDACDEG